MNTVRRRNTHGLPAIFEDLFAPDWFGGFSVNAPITTLPAINIKESDRKYAIEVAAPGIQKEDFSIELDNEVLTISVNHKKTEEEEGLRFSRKEFDYTSFKRSFTLPDTVDAAAIAADHTNGILVVDLPKRKEAQPQPKRHIAVS